MSTPSHTEAIPVSTQLPWRLAIGVFLVFAASYFLSALLRAVTATLAPTLSLELDLQASDLGLLAGGYFLGFAATQLPLGRWLDRHGAASLRLVYTAGGSQSWKSTQFIEHLHPSAVSFSNLE